MKRYFLLLLYIAGSIIARAQADPAYPPSPAAAQNIVAAEYFIDIDPGYGNGVAIPLSPGVNIINAAFNANTASLGNGIHHIVIRVRSNEGRWSAIASRDFLVDSDPSYVSPAMLQNVSAAEYFIDTDPGAGNGTSISITAGTDVSNIAAAINVTGLSTGAHRLYIRTRSDNGIWSITHFREFVVNFDFPYVAPPPAIQNIIAAEYFFDIDPGVGSGIAISLSPGTDIDNTLFKADISSLSIGTHRIYIRTKNNEGSWSLTTIKDFIVDTEIGYPPTPPAPLSIVAAEYFFDTDPGNGNGTSIAITPGMDINNISTEVNTSSLAPGDHRLYLRTLNAEGNWSITSQSSFTYGATPSWTIEPATGHDFGNVAVGGFAGFPFKIRNTGNVQVTLSEVSSSNPVFTLSYTSGRVIPVGDSITVPVYFSPTAIMSYNAVLKIKAGAGGPDSVTTIINGTGFNPAIPPVLSFVAAAPYNGVSGVNPAAGQTGNYTYKIVYRSADNRAPADGFPKVGIDLNGDQDYDDLGEGLFTMNHEGISDDYATGATYTYTANYTNYSSSMGYRFFANDALGNAATGNNAGWYAGPVITYELLDLKLFANDISFSKSNPLPGETFTLTATITNNSAFTATNVPVNFYRDSILIGSTVLPTANAFSTATVSHTLSFATDGFYPIKVWIDPNATLNDNNVLNNYAIRPVVVGSPVLPGGITVTASTSVQNCPSQKIIFSGHADYFGTSIPTAVAGATVSINTGSSVLTTNTDANGNFNLVMENPPCGGMLTYTVVVTDFTFTSNTFTGAQQVTCPAANACTTPQVPGGGVAVSVSTTPCSTVAGSNTTAQLKIKYRGRNPANMWGLWDKIWKDTVKVFNNGVLIQTFYSHDNPDFGSAGTFPGDEKIIPVTIPLGSTGPNNIEVVASYVYNEFFQNETPFYHGTFTSMTATASATIIATPDKPDLTLGEFQQTSFRSFTFRDINKECVAAGSHLVRIVDVTNPGSPVTVQTNTVASVGPQSSVTITASFPALAPGIHQFRIFTDTTNLVDESDEDNNVFLVTLNVPASDLIVFKVKPSTTDLPQGASVTFDAAIVNTGIAAGPFTVRFMANGVQIGNDINVAGIGERDQVVVRSDAFTIPDPETACPIDITVIADAGSTVNESAEGNNSQIIKLGSDMEPLHQPGEFGSASNPVRVRVNTEKQFNAYIRNTGTRDIHNVTVKFMHNGTWLGNAVLPLIRAGVEYPAVASFTHTFTTPGNTTVDIITDTANLVCEISEGNNTGSYHIVVTDSKEDFVVLSQFISPSNLNPNAGQNITIVGTVKNIGNRVAPPSSLRFYVDDIQLGAAVPFNNLQIGQDTTVAATVSYSSSIDGLKVIKIKVDEASLIDEEDETNNEATRIIIVGNAPDMASAAAQAISFNPSGFTAGDSVTVAYQLRNSGSAAGSAWVRFKIFDAAGSLTAIDSVAFTLQAGSNTTVSRRMHFLIDSGYMVTEIVNCSPLESNLLNNSDTLHFSTVVQMKANLTVNNLDMKAGAPQQMPGWIGGKIMLGDYDLTVVGNIVNFDTAHFIITNGNGRLKIINGNQQNLFPVGAGLYRTNFARIDNAGVPDNFSVRVQPFVLRNGISGDTIRNSNVNITWMIDEELPGGSNASVELWWNASDELPGFDRTISKIAHYTGNWQLSQQGNALADTNGIYSRMQTGYTSFSPFTVTSGVVFVPLKFTSFTATPNGNDVLLKWTTEAETNTSHFDVEFSTDGSSFTKIGKVASLNTAGEHRYSCLHQSPAGNTLYYRIRQVDLDGEFEYSKIVTVKLQVTIDITLAPNPAHQYIQLRNADMSQLREIRILSGDGKMVKRLAANLSPTINIQQLKNGMYYVQLFGKDGRMVTMTFVKQ